MECGSTLAPLDQTRPTAESIFLRGWRAPVKGTPGSPFEGRSDEALITPNQASPDVAPVTDQHPLSMFALTDKRGPEICRIPTLSTLRRRSRIVRHKCSFSADTDDEAFRPCLDRQPNQQRRGADLTGLPRASNPTSGEKPTSLDSPGTGVAYDRLDDTDR